MPRWLYWLLLAYAAGIVLTIIAFRQSPFAQTFVNYAEWPKFWVNDPSGMWLSFQYGLGVKNPPAQLPTDAYGNTLPTGSVILPPIVTASGSQTADTVGHNGQRVTFE